MLGTVHTRCGWAAFDRSVNNSALVSTLSGLSLNSDGRKQSTTTITDELYNYDDNQVGEDDVFMVSGVGTLALSLLMTKLFS